MDHIHAHQTFNAFATGCKILEVGATNYLLKLRAAAGSNKVCGGGHLRFPPVQDRTEPLSKGKTIYDKDRLRAAAGSRTPVRGSTVPDANHYTTAATKKDGSDLLFLDIQVKENSGS